LDAANPTLCNLANGQDVSEPALSFCGAAMMSKHMEYGKGAKYLRD
jgi:hypothetical protein